MTGAAAGGAPAVFLDRDGVLTRNVLNPATGEHESPLAVADLAFLPRVDEALRGLRGLGYKLFLVSNQPNHAKGKCDLATLEAIQSEFQQTLEKWGVPLDECFVCYHHPEGVTPGYSGPCACRKPGTLFVDQAAERYGLARDRSWMVGDRECDIRCGQAAGLKTILILEPTSAAKRGRVRPDFTSPTLFEAVEIIRRSQA